MTGRGRAAVARRPAPKGMSRSLTTRSRVQFRTSVHHHVRVTPADPAAPGAPPPDPDRRPDLPPRHRALAEAVTDMERHVARRGWDGPVALFALVRTAQAIAREPRLAEELPQGVREAAALDPEHLTCVEQAGLPETESLEDLLAGIAWPDSVDGAALVVERVVVPPEAERDLPTDPEEALASLAAHPDREDVRIAAGVLRAGEAWCALRVRSHDSDDAVGGAVDAVPGLVEALRATLD